MQARATEYLVRQRVQLVEAAELETLSTRGGGEVPSDAVLPPAGVGKPARYCGLVHRDGLDRAHRPERAVGERLGGARQERAVAGLALRVPPHRVRGDLVDDAPPAGLGGRRVPRAPRVPLSSRRVPRRCGSSLPPVVIRWGTGHGSAGDQGALYWRGYLDCPPGLPVALRYRRHLRGAYPADTPRGYRACPMRLMRGLQRQARAFADGQRLRD